MGKQDKYTYRVQWSKDDERFVATVAEMPSLSWLADSPEAALKGLRKIIKDVVADMYESEKPITELIIDRDYSGHFTLRLTKDQHRILALHAAEQHISINKLAASLVASGVQA